MMMAISFDSRSACLYPSHTFSLFFFSSPLPPLSHFLHHLSSFLCLCVSLCTCRCASTMKEPGPSNNHSEEGGSVRRCSSLRGLLRLVCFCGFPPSVYVLCLFLVASVEGTTVVLLVMPPGEKEEEGKTVKRQLCLMAARGKTRKLPDKANLLLTSLEIIEAICLHAEKL